MPRGKKAVTGINRTERISFRVTEAEKTQIQKKAMSAGMELCDFIRKVIFDWRFGNE